MKILIVILLIRAIIISSTNWLSSQPLHWGSHVSHITTAYNVGEDRLKIGCREEAFNKRTNMVIVQLTRITRKKGQWGVITCNQRLLVPYSLVTSHVMVASIEMVRWPISLIPYSLTMTKTFNMYVCIRYPSLTGPNLPLSLPTRDVQDVLTQHTQVVHCPVTSKGCICEHLIPEWYTMHTFLDCNNILKDTFGTLLTVCFVGICLKLLGWRGM